MKTVAIILGITGIIVSIPIRNWSAMAWAFAFTISVLNWNCKGEEVRKRCVDCKYGIHPEWAVMVPWYLICTNERSLSGRIDVERNIKLKGHCGPEGKWWISKGEEE